MICVGGKDAETEEREGGSLGWNQAMKAGDRRVDIRASLYISPITEALSPHVKHSTCLTKINVS